MATGRSTRGITDGIEPLIEETMEVAATPERVWALVSDLPRLAEWSPQVVRSLVLGRGPVRRGSRLLNLNRRGLVVWPTRSEVVRFEPPQAVAFRIPENLTTWSFVLEPTERGTRIVHRREAPEGILPISYRLTERFLGGEESFQAELREGMRSTLDRIRATAEGSG